VDPSDQLFRPDHVLQVQITMAAADWARLRQGPEIVPIPRTTCRGPASGEAYPTFHAEVDIDGLALHDVSIRKKGGLGSIANDRPGLKLDVHEFVPDQRVFGLKHLTLNNNRQDDSRIRQCIGYALFAQAGLPAPRCSFAHVTVNGEDLGVYSNVETIKDNFLRRNFNEDTGNVYESGGDFTVESIDDFQPKASPADCSDLHGVTTALAASDAQLPTTLGAVLDLDEVTRYWAMEVLLGHWDGYANNRNNFYMYHQTSTNKFQFIPWGIDAIFEARSRTTRPESVYACGSLAWRLYNVPTTRAAYLASLRAQLATWNPTAVIAEVDRMVALIDPYEPTDLTAPIAAVKSFVQMRGPQLLAELGGADPVWPYPQGQESCLIQIGSLTTTFSAPFNRLDRYDVGTGTITGTVSGIDLASAAVKASAGMDADGKIAFHTVSPLADGRYAVVFFNVAPAQYTVGTHPIDLSNLFGVMVFYDPATNTSSGGGLLLPGSLTLTTNPTTTDALVNGTLTGTVREL
jgi:hypothetical protein